MLSIVFYCNVFNYLYLSWIHRCLWFFYLLSIFKTKLTENIAAINWDNLAVAHQEILFNFAVYQGVFCVTGSFKFIWKTKTTLRISTEEFSVWKLLPGMEAKRKKRTLSYSKDNNCRKLLSLLGLGEQKEWFGVVRTRSLDRDSVVLTSFLGGGNIAYASGTSERAWRGWF